MKKRAVIGAIVATCFVLLVVSAILVVRFSSRSPIYQGHRVEYWLGEVFTTNQGRALQVLREAGPEVAPALVRAFETTDTSWRKFYAKTYAKLPASWQKHLARPVPAKQIWNAAQLVLLNNAKAARAARPGLLRLLSNKDNQAHEYIISSLNNLGPQDSDAVPVFIQCLRETNSMVRQSAAAGLGAIGSYASAAIPVLTNILNDPDIELRVQTAWALWKISHQTNLAAPTLKAALKSAPAERAANWAAIYLSEIDTKELAAVPVLIGMLQSNDEDMRGSATIALRSYGRAASAAVPGLEHEVENGTPYLKENALLSLMIIDPEAAAKYGRK